MKICYVISTVNVAGGANRSLLDMIPYIQKAGNECHVLGSAPGTMKKAVEDLGARYHVIPFSTYVKAGNNYRQLKRDAINIYGKKRIQQFLKNNRIDLLHNNSLPTGTGMSAALAAGIPYICHIRENIWSGLGMEFSNPTKIKKIIKNAEKVITISKYIEKSYMSFEPCGEYITIHDGIKISDYLTYREIFTNSEIHMGIIGAINPQKGQREAVEAIKSLRESGYNNIYLDIIGKDFIWKGNTNYATELREYVEDGKMDYIHFIDPIEDIGELKRRRSYYDINIICSNSEGLGRTTIESMLSGSLTIAAEAGATPEILEDMKYGLLYKSGNANDLAKKIEYAINHKNEMKKIAREAQNYAKTTFDIEEYSKKILMIYNTTQSKKASYEK